MITIGLIDLGQTQALRQEVLRDGRPANVKGPTDDLPETFHVGAVDASGEVLGTSTYFPADCQYEPETPGAYMLRYMAVSPGHQGTGLGGAIIECAVEVLRERGATLLWANARDTALKFYLDRGFSAVEGSQFEHVESGIPHTVVVRRLGP
jgi:GNAT superfamily N-acetyltransferase